MPKIQRSATEVPATEVRLTVEIRDDGAIRTTFPHLTSGAMRQQADSFCDGVSAVMGPMRVEPTVGWPGHRISDDRRALLEILMDAHRRLGRVVAFPARRHREG